MSTRNLLSLSLPLVRTYGFTTNTLVRGSLLLPSPHTPPPPGYSPSTLNALFPSPPPRVRPHSLSRDELIADARGEMEGESAGRERFGPAKALVEEFLEEGRREMVRQVRSSGLKGEAAIRHGMETRVRYNEDVLDYLPEALALLTVSDASPLASVTALIPIPSPAAYLEHVATIAHDLAGVAGDQGQGLDWYAQRARLGTIYGMAELHLLSPTLAKLPPSERVNSTLELVDRLFSSSSHAHQKLNDAGLFGQFIVRSWAGLFRSAGL